MCLDAFPPLQHNQRKQTCLRDCEDGQSAGLLAQHRLSVGLHGTVFRGMLQVIMCERGAGAGEWGLHGGPGLS